MRPIGRRTVHVALLVAALLIAGVLSFHASSHPDGLEHVAQSTGFLDTATEHAGADGPLADYGVRGVDDARVSGGLAGVIGVVVTLLLAGGLARVLRRRGGAAEA
jgi:cobalt/nickel transport protein